MKEGVYQGKCGGGKGTGNPNTKQSRTSQEPMRALTTPDPKPPEDNGNLSRSVRKPWVKPSALHGRRLLSFVGKLNSWSLIWQRQGCFSKDCTSFGRKNSLLPQPGNFCNGGSFRGGGKGYAWAPRRKKSQHSDESQPAESVTVFQKLLQTFVTITQKNKVSKTTGISECILFHPCHPSQSPPSLSISILKHFPQRCMCTGLNTTIQHSQWTVLDLMHLKTSADESTLHRMGW